MPIGAYATQQVIAETVGYMEGSIPLDAHELLGLWVVLIPLATDPDWAGSIDIYWSTNGEAHGSGSSGAVLVAWSLVDKIIFNHDAIALVTPDVNPIAPCDVYGVSLVSNAGNEIIELLGTVIRYRVGYPVQGGLGLIRHQFYPCQTWTIP